MASFKPKIDLLLSQILRLNACKLTTLYYKRILHFLLVLSLKSLEF